MPVRMIELEEVTMFEYSDDAFEATVAGYGGGIILGMLYCGLIMRG